MEVLDIHTHRAPQVPFNAIWNCMPTDMPFQNRGQYCSVGIHPWHISETTFDEQKEWVEAAVWNNRQLIAIGETGLDKFVDIPWEVQLSAFKWQVELSEKARLPLILHVVKAHNEIIDLKKKYYPGSRWIIHGFRGKKQLAEQYLKEGFWLSFGEHYNEEALRTVPPERRFFETDDSPLDIHDIYIRAAKTLHLPVEELTKQTQLNIRNVFFNE